MKKLSHKRMADKKSFINKYDLENGFTVEIAHDFDTNERHLIFHPEIEKGRFKEVISGANKCFSDFFEDMISVRVEHGYKVDRPTRVGSFMNGSKMSGG